MGQAEELPLLQRLAEKAVDRWAESQGAKVSLLNVAENTTYLAVSPEGAKSVLRIHRQGYHSKHAIACELAWIDALGRDGGVETPGYYLGLDGEAIQEVAIAGLPGIRHAVLFSFLPGAAPEAPADRIAAFEILGAIAARCHVQVSTWEKPQPFERLTWDVEAVFGPQATWGDWRDAPGVTGEITEVLERVEQAVRDRLAAYGKGSDRYNLIHADMRLANLLADETGVRVIDFDDCGWGWFMYDFAAAISFIEDDPVVPDLRAAWLKGYLQVRPLSPADEAEMDTFIMLRRMALLAWIGSHIEAPEPQAMAPHFAQGTADLGRDYLRKQGK